MRWRNIITGAVLGGVSLGMAPGFTAQAQAACPRVAAPVVSVQVIDPGPRVSSTNSIQQINVMDGGHGLQRPGFRVLGMTRIKVLRTYDVRYRTRPVAGGFCVHVDNVSVKFGLKDHTVLVPREYARGSCQFRFIVRHEMAHVDVNRRTARKYATVLKNEMRSALRRAGASSDTSAVRAQNAQTAVMQKVIDDVIGRFHTERTALHDKIDDPNNAKYAAKGKCNGW